MVCGGDLGALSFTALATGVEEVACSESCGGACAMSATCKLSVTSLKIF